MLPSSRFNDRPWMERRQVNRRKADSSAEDAGHFDRLVGDFGYYQFLIFMFKIGIGFVTAFNGISITFTAPSKFISHWCENQQNASLTSSPGTNHLSSIYSLGTLLSDMFDGQVRSHKHASITSYNTPQNIRQECTYQAQNSTLNHRCVSFRYDTGIWISTIVEEWDLVCDRSWIISLSHSLYFSGFVVAYMVYGYMSDKYGRWIALLIGASCEIFAGLGCALSTSIHMYVFFRFFLGFGNAGRNSTSYLIMIEWFGPKWRVFISTAGSLGWVTGYILLPWFARYFLHFRHLQLFVCFYEVIWIALFFKIPESPRWLLTHKRFDEAYAVLLKAANFNGLINDEPRRKSSYMASTRGASSTENVTEHPTTTKTCTAQEFDMKFRALVENIKEKEFSKNEDNLNPLDLFRWPNIRCYALISFFIWATNAFIYYGIVLNVGDFGGNNLFVAFTIAGLMEIPSLILTVVTMYHLPRKTTNIISNVAVGLLCLCQIGFRYYKLDSLQQTVMMLAKLFNTYGFFLSLYQTMELFPTSIRHTAYSYCSLFGRIGSLIAPFIKELNKATSHTFTLSLYILISVITGLLVVQLPETKGVDMRDTLKEAENFRGSDKKAAQSREEKHEQND